MIPKNQCCCFIYKNQAVLLTAICFFILLLNFCPLEAAVPTGESVGSSLKLPARPIFSLTNPGIHQIDAAHHTPEITIKTRHFGLEQVKLLEFHLPERVPSKKETTADPLTKVFVLDKDDAIIGYYELQTGDQDFNIMISGNINYIKIYVECKKHGLWFEDRTLS